ncbi:lipocalin [Prosthecochloris sp. GSB1]|uniref:lipocalin family protein n=1 Tax=Prosthecochloris sp. GSB1 TaxID=281093 RepID=UPI000B8CC3A0|nr:lipocalin family protein [Prosthecochloris sp. GSB1]ASQ90888.1 lipocalin [Prosthecochloris sp. GSB1]
MFKRLLVFLPLFLFGCIRIPEGVDVVEGFELERYLGTWYEIARTENAFEKNFSAVTATYSLDTDGSVRVLNKGYHTEKGEWRETKAKAKFVDDPSKGALKVSFFGPFYSSYNIIDLDSEGYRWAMVTGYKKTLFWILSRDPEMDPELFRSLVKKAEGLGFDTANLVIGGPEDYRRE